MNRVSRREFVKYATMGTAAATVLPGMTALSADKVAGANSAIRLAIIGVGGKGRQHTEIFNGIQGVDVVTICDADTQRAAEAASKVRKNGGKVKVCQDMREVFADDSIDAICTATPNHWHALTTIWALQAGKHVYVEKPVTYNLSEGRAIMQAAKKYGKIVQAGFQSRSDTGLLKFYPYLHKGKLGKIEMLYGQCLKARQSIGAKLDKPLTPPETVDYNLWLGPADDEPIMRPRFHYDWHWNWNTGNGDIGNQGPHEIDILMWARKDDKAPKRVMTFGERFGWNDAGETANMQLAMFDFGDYPCFFEVRNMSMKPGMKAGPANHGMRVGLYVKCENGYFRGGRGGGKVYDNDGKVIEHFKGDGGGKHQQNFIDAIRADDPNMIHANIDDSVQSCDMAHYGNMALRTGRRASGAEVKEIIAKDDKAMETLELFEKQLGDWNVDTSKDKYLLSDWMTIDSKKRNFKGGDNYKEANKLTQRKGRKEFVVS